MQTYFHEAVLLEEVLELLRLRPGDVVLDGTIGPGGHAKEMIKRVVPGGLLIGIDRDEQVLRGARDNLSEFKNIYKLFYSGFDDCREVLRQSSVKRVDAALLDLGASSIQLDDPSRGFSFLKDGPLDMRMDVSSPKTAADVLNRYSTDELIDIFRNYGQERYAGRFARAIVQDRKRKPFTRTLELGDLAKRLTGGRRFRIHPATRIFQALRIEINGELDALESFLKVLPEILAPGARAAIISFHSLEDALAKRYFKEGARSGLYDLQNKKPITAGEDEVLRNPRSRSAKLRGIVRLPQT